MLHTFPICTEIWRLYEIMQINEFISKLLVMSITLSNNCYEKKLWLLGIKVKISLILWYCVIYTFFNLLKDCLLEKTSPNANKITIIYLKKKRNDYWPKQYSLRTYSISIINLYNILSLSQFGKARIKYYSSNK